MICLQKEEQTLERLMEQQLILSEVKNSEVQRSFEELLFSIEQIIDK